MVRRSLWNVVLKFGSKEPVQEMRNLSLRLGQRFLTWDPCTALGSMDTSGRGGGGVNLDKKNFNLFFMKLYLKFSFHSIMNVGKKLI
jgi:hypothetical protein